MKRILLALLAVFLLSTVAQAQSITEQDAIDLASSFEAFHDSLTMYPDWTAHAYDTGNAYGIWRVQFWGAEGDDLGYADVNPAQGRVYDWESHIGATDAEKSAAEQTLRDFVVGLPEVNELVEDPAQYPMYVDYNDWAQAWGVYLDRGQDSLYILVQFDGRLPGALDNPRLLRIQFSEVMAYDDWVQSKQAIAVATAFKDADIADALSGVDGWTTSVHRQDDGLWSVTFLSGDQTLAEVTVDLSSNQVIEHRVGG